MRVYPECPYTRQQVARYYDRIDIPEGKRIFDVRVLSTFEQLDHLALLQTKNLVSIPFENLSLHYSQYRGVLIDPLEILEKIVESDGNSRGGYCMETNALFGSILKSIGYDVYPVGSRVLEEGRYGGFSHMVNLVRIGGHKYHVDVGFGPNGPTKPNKLERDTESPRVQTQIAPTQMRLIYKNTKDSLDPDQRVWCYQVKIDDQAEFVETYHFIDVEFLRRDYEIMNYYTSTSPQSWFTYQVICSKMLLNDEGIINGVVILQSDLKYRINGKTEQQGKFQSEKERVKALEDNFNIKLTPSQAEAIKMLASQVR